MSHYPKKILSLSEQLDSYKQAGMLIPSEKEALAALRSIGYYRLRGYSFHKYDNAQKKYLLQTSFDDILKLYYFDRELSHLLFAMTSKIEISLRAHLCDALLIHQDALALTDPTYFADKKLFWQNLSSLTSEISRSNDVFVLHHYQNYEGMIPVWAAVEVMSFGNLSKTIKNLKTGKNSAASKLLSDYSFVSSKGNVVQPSMDMFTSWTQGVVVLRNICAHNSRIYHRTISTHIQIPQKEHLSLPVKNNGLYQFVIAMKYLRPDDAVWNHFVFDIEELFDKYQDFFSLDKLNFPPDWKERLLIPMQNNPD